MALYSPYPGFHEWEINEIFRGELDSDGLYIPRLNDLVTDVQGRRQYKVAHVDQTTGISSLVVWDAINNSGSMDDLDIFTTIGPGTASEAFRIYIDSSNVSQKLAFDDRVHIYSSDAVAVKVFLGADIEDSPTTISAFYNQSGVLVSDSIPLELVTSPDNNNISIKRPVLANCTMALADGEVVTAVVYGASGGVLSYSQFVIKNSQFIRGVSAATKYVTGISIKSPFVSKTDMRVLNFPINQTIDSSHLLGVVHYNDGTTKEYPIDGDHFDLHGINNYVSTQAGQRTPAALSYHLDANEQSYSGNVSYNGVWTEPYYLVSVALEGMYAVKLFGYPRWLDANRGYAMEYYLYNLDRNLVVPVTPWVYLAANSAPFSPKLYGTVQNFTLSLNLQDINPQYEAYVHVQQFSVTLNNPGSSFSVPNWTVGYVADQSPRYGATAVARIHSVGGNVWNINIDCGATTKEAWIEKLYTSTIPLTNVMLETSAPAPSHVELVFNNFTMEIAVEQFADTLIAPNDLPQGSLLGMRWIRRMNAGDLQLAYSALPVHIV